MRSLFLSLLFLPLFSAAQMGIGRMVIGVTRIDSLQAILGERLETSSEPIATAKFNSTTPVELTIPKDGSVGQKSKADFIPGYRFVHLGLWQAADLKFTGIEMIFHDDLLISFRSDIPFGLRDVMDRKYGSGILKNVKDTISCVDKQTGQASNYRGYTLTVKWQAGEHSAIEYMAKKYDENCKPKNTTFFSMGNSRKYVAYTDDVNNKTKHTRPEKGR